MSDSSGMAVTDAPHYQSTSCPLCGETFDRPAGFRDHLFYAHDLMDDEGTETTLDVEPEPEPEPEPVASPMAAAAAAAITPFAPSRPRRAPSVAPAADRTALEQRHLWLVPALILAIFVELLVSVGGLSVVAKDDSRTRVATAADTSSDGSSGAAAAPTTPTTAPRAPAHDADADQRFAEQFAPQGLRLPGRLDRAIQYRPRGRGRQLGQRRRLRQMRQHHRRPHRHGRVGRGRRTGP
jgi:hypothetical protein